MELPSGITQHWNIYPLLTDEQFKAFQQAGIEAIHAQLLYNRGITTVEEMQAFLAARYDQTPDPLTLIDMHKAVARIQHALAHDEHITVYGDYDADGVTSSALLFRALRTLKHPDAPLDYHIPSRLKDGCGLNLSAIDMLKARGTTLIITTDCASSDVEQVAYARTLGIDVIITDHHQPPEQRPDAFAMINPWRPDCQYGERYLCGVGVAFKLTQALFRAYQRPVEDEMALLDLVAIGTIADVATLLGENHTLVRHGLARLNQTQNPGLHALIKKTNLQPGKIRERDIAFSLAPRINAAGRMSDARIAFDLLTTDDDNTAAAYAEELENLNISRQQQTEELMSSVRQEAQLRPNDQVVLVSGDNWPEGIIGLVAGKLSEEINRPVLVLSRGTEYSRGSARNPDKHRNQGNQSEQNGHNGINIIRALRACADILTRYGGHAQAAGFTIANRHIEQLRTHLLAWKEQPNAPESIAEKTPDASGIVIEQEDNPFSQATSMIDIAFTKIEMLNYESYRKIRELGPFGAGNPEPVFQMKNLRLLDRWTSGFEGRNLRLRLGTPGNGASQRLGTLTRGSSRIQTLHSGQMVNIIFRLESAWNLLESSGKQDIWLKLLEVEVTP
ncbi:MAG TPA: single-stranded-DNA-specific exonuclease RecJ [Ktedonobacteraceae bacterium]|nr:single-stranded-DNA-specific exonuclease RecJ [Ktedonobacteraceae bacterium]